VTARDKDTGAEQGVTITESSNLDTGEIDRMVKEAEEHRAEDTRIREEIDARNELDAIAYQVERRLSELGDQAPMHEKARAEQLVEQARNAVKEAAPLETVRPLIGELQQVFHSLGSVTAGGGGPDVDVTDQPASSSDDDVIDADFTVS
jgi:molecular chaperone DnaK